MKGGIHKTEFSYANLSEISTDYIECAVRPSDNHTLSDNWENDPMDPDVCWRVKNTSELDAEKDLKADISNINPAVRALFEAINDGTFVPGSNYTNPQIKQIIVDHL